MMRNIHFLSGMPRSGTTVIAAVLNQHPQIFASNTSSLLPTLGAALQGHAGSQHTIANNVEGQTEAILRSVVDGMYSHIEKPIIFDKNRSWPSLISLSMMEKITGKRPKVICPVRPIPDVLTSWLAKLKDNGQLSFIEQEMKQRGYPLNDEGRCQYLMGPHGNVREAWALMKEAFNSEYKDCLLFVEYDDLIRDPQSQMDRIHDFIELDRFAYDFANLSQPVAEDDVTAYGIKDLHKVRPRLEKVSRSAVEVLGQRRFEFYSGGEFWNEKPEAEKLPQTLDLQLEASLRGQFDKGWTLAQLADPEDARAQFNKGWYVVQRGDLAAGIALMDRGREENIFGNPSTSGMPIWQGQQLHGETVLLWSEGGMGDQIISARFSKTIVERGGHCVLACHQSLAGVLSHVPGVSAVVQSEAGCGVFHQLQLPGMSAPAYLGIEYDDLDGSAYLPWQQINNGGPRKSVGICWRGNPEMSHDEYRQFDPDSLFNLRGVDLVSLQQNWDGDLPRHIQRPKLDRWEDTATVIAGLDLVITSCTAVAHLAAAMGKETWVLVPLLPYYIWAKPGCTSPWYDSVRLFRQTAFKDWSSALGELEVAFQGWRGANIRQLRRA